MAFKHTLFQLKPIRKYIDEGYLRYTPDLFTSDLTADQKRSVFKRFVKSVEFEPHSFCNRTCSFCPNSYIDRRSHRHYLDAAAYQRALDDLARIGFNGTIGYARYCEPLADPVTFDRLTQARQALPQAKLSIYSNGDYLDPEKLDRLADIGLNALTISLYPRQFSNENVKESAAKLMDRLPPIPFELISDSDDIWVRYRGEYRGIKLNVMGKNFAEMGVDRGGLAVRRKQQVRRSACSVVFQHVYIEYTGTVVPCCNLRSDVPEQAGYVLGNIADQSLFDIFTSPAYVGWRQSMYGIGAKAEPCTHCTFMQRPTNPINRLASRVLQPCAFEPPKAGVNHSLPQAPSQAA